MTDPRLASLRTLLAAHHPADNHEADYLSSMLALLKASGDCLSRFHFEPGHFTASAFVLSPDRSSLLLIHHSKLGKWLQPGGHIESEDADLGSAARREVFEETGLRELEALGLVDIDIHQFPEGGDGPAHDHLDVRFGFRAASEDAIAGDGTVEVKWFGLNDVSAWNDRPSLSRPAKKLLVPRSK